MAVVDARRASRLCRAAVVLAVLLLTGAPLGPPASADDTGGPGSPGSPGVRLATIVDTLSHDQPYVEPQEAGGDAALWTERLTTALAAQRFGAPVRVAAWVREPDGPEPDDVETAVDASVLILAYDGHVDVVAHGLSAGLRVRASRRAEQAEAIVREALRLSGRDQEATTTLPLATAWVWLRLAAADPPTATALARELAADPAVLTDARYDLPQPDAEVDPDSPFTLTVIGLLVLLFLGWRAARAWRRRGRTPQHPVGPDPAPASTTRVADAARDTQLQQRVAELAEAISRSPARPGELGYDRAQACLDAASWYADHERTTERQRLGVDLLTTDGLAWLGGHPPHRRCYFNPRHALTGSGDVVVHDEVAVPCCAECARVVRAGGEPDVLETDGRPYFARDDVWSATGYGSLSPDWAEQVYRAALEDRR